MSASLQAGQLKPRHAVIAGEPGCASIHIDMAPFVCDGELIDTSIRLDGVDIPVHLRELLGKSYTFAVGEDAEIDGSIYLDHAHHPVDISSLTFHAGRDGSVTMVVKGVYLFEFEGLHGLKNTPFTFGVGVSSGAI